MFRFERNWPRFASAGAFFKRVVLSPAAAAAFAAAGRAAPLYPEGGGEGAAAEDPAARCAAQCLARRSSEDDFESCNGYLVAREDGECKVGYAEPIWILEDAVTDPEYGEGDGVEVYFDASTFR